MTDTEWTSAYPDPERLRNEVRVAADTYIEAIKASVPAADIAGIYVKGSGLKTWTSPIDYVPVLSDVDIHLLLADDAAASRFYSVDVALEVSRRSEHVFCNAIPNPIHVPRIQLVNANRLFAEPDYVPSPASTVEVRYGKPYPINELEPSVTRQLAITVTLDQQARLETLADSLVDKTGPYLRTVLRDLGWRVSPTGPRMLELLGVPFETCWSSNRSRICELLEEVGEVQLAVEYRTFYLAAWQYFLSGDGNGELARRAIHAGVEVLRGGIEIAARVEQVIAETT